MYTICKYYTNKVKVLVHRQYYCTVSNIGNDINHLDMLFNIDVI